MNTLEWKICQEIVASYSDSIDYKRDIDPTSYTNRLRAFITGSAYCGPYARFWLWDFLAGGVQNNFFFSYFARSDYGAFIYFLDEIKKNHPEPQTVFSAIEKTKNTKSIYDIIQKNAEYLPKKYLIDLREQLTPQKRSLAEQSERNKNTWSNRLSKGLTFLGAICEGCIDILGISWLSSYGWFIALGAGTMPLFLACFVGGFVACYYIYRQDSAGLFEEILSGNLFYKNLGTIDKPDYQPLNTSEKTKIALAMIMSACSGISVYALVIPAIQSALTIISIAAPLLAIQILAIPMIFLIGALSFNAAKKLIQENQENASDEPMTAREIAKFCLALFVSAIVAAITFFLFKSKLGALFSKSSKVVATVAACLLAGFTALMRFAFSIVTLGKRNSCATKQEEEPLQAPGTTLPSPSTTTARLIISGIAAGHAIPQGGLFVNTALQLASGTPLRIPLAIVAGISNFLLARTAAEARMSQDHSLEKQKPSMSLK